MGYIIIIVFFVITVFGAVAAIYFLNRHRYLEKAKLFAERNSLAIEEISVAGLDVALSGKLEGRSIKTSIVRIRVNEIKTEEGVTPDVYGTYFEAYSIEINIDKSHQWLAVMNFEYNGRERIVSPEMPRYSKKFTTASGEFDRLFLLFAEAKPTHRLFENPLLLKELMDCKLRAAHANLGTLHLYFERPMFRKYSSFERVENLIRLALRITL